METTNKKIGQTSKNVQTKKEVKTIIAESKNLMNDDNLLNLDLNELDNQNFNLLVNELTKNVKQNSTTNRIKMFKIEVDKQKRKKIRNIRDKHFKNILYFFAQKNETELKKEIKEFNEFYKNTYSLNDYSIESCVFNNSDNETKIISKTALEIIKKQK